MTTFGYSLFCDDIRHEINGKISLIGCYSNIMFFHDEFPNILPKFVVFSNLSLPSNRQFKKIELFIELEQKGHGTKRIAEMLVKFEDVMPDKNGAFDDKEETNLQLTSPFLFSPLELKNEGKISTRALIDGEDLIKMGSLLIKYQSTESAALKP